MIRVAVEGASGYVGGELLSLLFHDPEVELVAATAGQAGGEELAELRPRFGASSLRLLKELGPDHLEDLDLLYVLKCNIQKNWGSLPIPKVYSYVCILNDSAGHPRSSGVVETQLPSFVPIAPLNNWTEHFPRRRNYVLAAIFSRLSNDSCTDFGLR